MPRAILRASFVAALSAVAACRARPILSATAACPGCNVILISVDTLRADELGAYGSRRGATPNLDVLARRGATFLDAFSHVPDTLPSDVSLFTSQYPWTHGVSETGRGGLKWGTPTLASVLREYGYRTVWAGTTDAYNGYLVLRGGFDDAAAPRVWKHDWSGAFSWLERNQDAPFFMFLHTWSAQSPYTPADSAARRFLPALDPGKSISYEALEREAAAFVLRAPQKVFAPSAISAHPEIFADAARPPKWSVLAELLDARIKGRGKHPSSWKVLDKVYWDRFDLRSSRDRAYVRALYDASVYEADESIGELLRRLGSLGLLKQTLIVVTADHGEAFGEHGTWRHGHGGNVHVEALRVPLIFAFPDARFRRRSNAVVQSIDVMPTVLQAVGAAPPASMQGESLMPIIAGGRADSSGTAFASWRGNYAARDARYACLLRDACPVSGAVADKRCLSLSLYDRRADPGETHDARNRAPAAAEKCEDLLLRRLTE